MSPTTIMNVISQAQIIEWLKQSAALMIENKVYLTELDSPIGDADHGINMERGFKKVMEKIDGFSTQDIGSILKTTGMTLISSVGGAAGPLYGTFFLEAGKVLATKMELTLEDTCQLMEKGMEGIQKRGRAVVGEKTIVDTLSPVVASLNNSFSENKNIQEAMEKALSVADKGMKSTIPLVAKKGRASYLGERSVGHQDPGATSMYFFVKALFDVIKTER